jgi:hypothetical protein
MWAHTRTTTHTYAFSRTCPLFFFYTKISLRAEFAMNISVQVYSLTASAYFNGTQMYLKKHYNSLNTYIIILSQSDSEKVRPAFGLRNVSENFGVQILNNLNSAKNTPMQALYTLLKTHSLTTYFNTVHKMCPGVARSTA